MVSTSENVDMRVIVDVLEDFVVNFEVVHAFRDRMFTIDDEDVDVGWMEIGGGRIDASADFSIFE